LYAAVCSAREGYNVIVVAANYNNATNLRSKVDHLDPAPGSIVVRIADENFDWNNLMPKWWGEKEVVYIDHQAIEEKFALHLAALHRFDEEGVDTITSVNYSNTSIEKGK